MSIIYEFENFELTELKIFSFFLILFLRKQAHIKIEATKIKIKKLNVSIA